MLMACLTTWLVQTLDLFRLMAPYLLLGFMLAGVLHALVPQAWVTRHLGGRGFRSAIKASIVGTPLPICSCGVIPFADLLKRQGASRSAITSFLISTPQTGVDSILAAYAILGWPLALWKVLTALFSGVFGGGLAGWVESRFPEGQAAAATTECGDSCCSAAAPSPAPVGAVARIVAGIRDAASYGMITMLGDIALWLVIGTLAGGAIAAFVPDDFLAHSIPNQYVQMLAVLAVAVPLYVCATGSVPVAAALVLKGMPLGAAIIFLIAGPATNIATLTVFTRVLGRRTVAVYLGTILVLSYAFGAAFNALFPGVGLASTLHADHLHAEVVTRMAWWEWSSSLLLALLVFRALLGKAHARWRRSAAPAAEPAATIDLKSEGVRCPRCRAGEEQELKSVSGVL